MVNTSSQLCFARWGILLTLSFIFCAADFAAIQLTNDPPDRPTMSAGYGGVAPLVMDPNVVSDSEGRHLFYSTYFCRLQDGSYHYSWDPQNSSNCDIERMVSAIGYAFSEPSNGDPGSINWQYRGSPIFAPGGEEWEQYKVETAFVLNNQTHLHLYYSAIGYINGTLLDNRYQLGVAFLDLRGSGNSMSNSIKSALLSTTTEFSRSFRNPLVAMDTVSSSFMNNVQEPSVVLRNGLFEVYFLGLQFSNPAVSPEAPDQQLQLIGLGCAVFDASFNLLSISKEPQANTAWRVNMPEVHYSSSTNRYTMISASLGSGEVHKGEVLQVSYADADDGGKELRWTHPQVILQPDDAAADFSFCGWATTSPTMTHIVGDNSKAVVEVFYSAFGANTTDNNGGCDYSTRFGIGVPDPACLYVTLGRAVTV